MDLQVADAYSEKGTSSSLTGVDTLTEEVIVDCERLITDFIDRWEDRFEDGLGSGQKRRLKRLWRSLQWYFQEREKVLLLRRKLGRAIQIITLLSTLSAR